MYIGSNVSCLREQHSGKSEIRLKPLTLGQQSHANHLAIDSPLHCYLPSFYWVCPNNLLISIFIPGWRDTDKLKGCMKKSPK